MLENMRCMASEVLGKGRYCVRLMGRRVIPAIRSRAPLHLAPKVNTSWKNRWTQRASLAISSIFLAFQERTIYPVVFTLTWNSASGSIFSWSSRLMVLFGKRGKSNRTEILGAANRVKINKLRIQREIRRKLGTSSGRKISSCHRRGRRCSGPAEVWNPLLCCEEVETKGNRINFAQFLSSIQRSSFVMFTLESWAPLFTLLTVSKYISCSFWRHKINVIYREFTLVS